MQSIKSYISNSIKSKQLILSNEVLLKNIELVIDKTIVLYKNKNKLILCGNGGSTCDANHIAEELTGKYNLERPALAAISLSDAAHITCTANDYGFEKIFERGVEAFGKKGDLLFAFSTSGNSVNVINAVKKANDLQMTTVGFSGKNGGKLKDICDINLICPSEKTSHIQEMHITIGHLIIEHVENALFLKE